LETSSRTRRTRPPARPWAALAILALLSPGCTRIDNALAAVPIFTFLREAPSFDPYEHPLPQPPGSVPYISPNGEVLAPLEASEAAFARFEASPQGRNPLAPNDPAARALGQVMYDRHCSVCHGPQGAGDGPLVGPGKFVEGFVPALDRGAALGRSDGYIYAVVRAGRGRMPAYGARMTHIERWSVVTYVNSLQGAAGAAQTDTSAGPAGPASQQ